MHRIINAVRGNIVAWLALFVALGGTSLAASHYIIKSPSQISFTARRELDYKAIRALCDVLILESSPKLQKSFSNEVIEVLEHVVCEGSLIGPVQHL